MDKIFNDLVVDLGLSDALVYAMGAGNTELLRVAESALGIAS